VELEVFWLEFAESKLEDIYSYYSIKASEAIAKKLIIGIIETTIGIENHPEIGQIEKNLINRRQKFRYLIYRNYKIIYWVNYEQGRVEIANIFDTRQDPDKMKKTE